MTDTATALDLLHSAFPGSEVVEVRHRRRKPLDHTPRQSLGAAAIAVDRANACAHPIRLSGSLEVTDSVTGDVVHQFSTEHDTEDNAIYVSCKTRRASRCESCAKTYQNDAFQLIAGGLRPGEFFDASILSRPALFVTFTAPSFGAVHSVHRDGSRCRPRRDGEICPHGRDLTCWSEHSDDEACVGQAICRDCFDYRSAVVWNASAGGLWRATVIDIERKLAALVGLSIKAMRRSLCRVRFVKVAEMHRRGLVHFHVAFRLDGPDGSSPDVSVEMFEEAVRASHSEISVIDPLPGSTRIRWGQQLDVDVIGIDVEREVLAGYFAKYATKSADARGLLDSRIQSEEQIDCLPISDHQARLVRAAWSIANEARSLDETREPRRAFVGGTMRIIKDGDQWLLSVTGGLAMNSRGRIRRHFATREKAFAYLRTLERHPSPLRELNLDLWAHQFGFRGHFLTKSRSVIAAEISWPGWSTTFSALRQRRADHNAALQRRSWQALSPKAQLVVVARWEYAGSGYRTPTEAHVAALMRGETSTIDNSELAA